MSAAAAEQVLLAYQLAVAQDKKRVLLIEKSRRIGLSWVVALMLCLEAAAANGNDGWYVGYNKDMSQEFIRDVATWARIIDSGASSVEESVLEDGEASILTYSVKFSSGFRVTALSSRPTNLRGKRGHIVIDEAAFHQDLAEILKSALAVLMWGAKGKGRVTIVSTHNGVDNYFNKLVQDVRAGKRPSFSLHRITLDDALAQGFYKRICFVNQEEWTPAKEAAWKADLIADYGDAADEELFCVPSKSGGTYIHRKLIENAMVPGGVVLRPPALPDDFLDWTVKDQEDHVRQYFDDEVAPLLRKLPRGFKYGAGLDFGRVSDRTVLVLGYLAQDLQRRVPFILELLNYPHAAQEQLVTAALRLVPQLVHACFDATGIGNWLAEEVGRKLGRQRIEAVTITPKWYAEWLPLLKTQYEDGNLLQPKDADHLFDLSAFKVVNGLPTLPNVKTKTATKGPSRHGDAGIAMALFNQAMSAPITTYEYQSVTTTEKTKPQISTGLGLKRRVGGLL